MDHAYRLKLINPNGKRKYHRGKELSLGVWSLNSGNPKGVSLKLLRIVKQLQPFPSSNATLSLVASYYLTVGRYIVVWKRRDTHTWQLTIPLNSKWGYVPMHKGPLRVFILDIAYKKDQRKVSKKIIFFHDTYSWFSPRIFCKSAFLIGQVPIKK